MKATALYAKHTMEELVALGEAIRSDPANHANGTRGLFLYTKAAERKLDAIAQAITWHLETRRAAAGQSVDAPGYTGSQRKKR